MVYRGDSLHGVHICDRDCYGECEKQAGCKNKTKLKVQNQHIRTSLTTTADHVEQISPWWHQTTQVTLSGTTYPEVTRDASLLSLVECAPPTPGAEIVCLDKNLRELIPGECECANMVLTPRWAPALRDVAVGLHHPLTHNTHNTHPPTRRCCG